MAKGGGGAWKVAYADFVTAMMALFLVLWLTAQSPEIKQAVARSFTNPFDSPTPPSTGMLDQSTDDEESQFESTKGDFTMSAVVELSVLKRLSQQMLEALHSEFSEDLSSIVQFRIEGENLRINVFDRPTHAVFEPESTRLTPFGEFIFSTLAWQVTHFPNPLLVSLEGHTGEGEGTSRDPHGGWDLSLDRANTVRRLLLDYKVPDQRVRTVSGYGDSLPLNADNLVDPINRRVSLILKLKGASQ